MSEDRPTINPLRRVFVPREFPIAEGGTVLRTTDGQTYRRGTDGAIRRAMPKVSGKVAKRARVKARRAEVTA
jgi:hypothetical protein